MDDEEIVELYLSRNEAAILHTAMKYGLRLRQIANRILGSMDAAEECENDTYLEAWNRIPPNEPRTYLFAFLGKITRHLAIDECRKAENQNKYAFICELTNEIEECIPGKSNVEGDVEAGALIESINAFLERCKDDQRDVFVRRYWHFDSVKEISKRYGYSQSKVKTMLFRMRESLLDHLKREGYIR